MFVLHVQWRITCPMAKFCKLPFSLSASQPTQPFQLIHIDIWGPYKVCTHGSFKFFMTIFDENSRHIWVSLLVQKSEALGVILTFYKYANTKFDKKVQTIRFDNLM